MGVRYFLQRNTHCRRPRVTEADILKRNRYAPTSNLILLPRGNPILIAGSISFGKTLKVALLSPKVATPFEASLLDNYCWRVDVFPPQLPHVKTVLRFCTQDKPQTMMVRQYTYLLDVRELGSKNSE